MSHLHSGCHWPFDTSYASPILCIKLFQKVKSGIIDERLKLVNDLVVGSRTIKCYGWEQHYIEKINQIRVKQMKEVIKLNILGSLGSSFFQNMGLVAIFIILWSEWY